MAGRPQAVTVRPPGLTGGICLEVVMGFVRYYFGLFLFLIVVLNIIDHKMRKRVDMLGYKKSLSIHRLLDISNIFINMDSIRIQKETGDKELKKMLILSATCKIVLFLLLLSTPFYYMVWPWIASML